MSEHTDLVPGPVQAPRLMSLDAFRGFVIASMFLVNVTANREVFPHQFFHEGWNDGRQGVTFTDMVFPWFLFIVGAAIPLSMSSGRGRKLGARRRILIALRRGVVIYLLGILIWCAKQASTTPISWRTFLHWDILQLIGAGYFLGVVLWHLPVWARWVFVGLVLVGKHAILCWVPHPEHGEVVWEATVNYQNHLRAQIGWFGGFVQALPATCIVLLGAATVSIMRDANRTSGQRLTRLFVFGIALTGASWLWHAPGGLPYSKIFFTSSYVLLAGGTGALLLAGFWWVIDELRWTKATFLRIFGLNAIALYVTAEVLWPTVMLRWLVTGPDGQGVYVIDVVRAWMHHWSGSLAVAEWAKAVAYVLALWLFALLLYRKRVFIKV